MLQRYNLNFRSPWDDLVIASQMVRLGISESYSNYRDLDKIPSVGRIF